MRSLYPVRGESLSLRQHTAAKRRCLQPFSHPMLKEFKQFLLRGNIIDLAVGVIVGGAFGTIVNALVKDILTPFIGAIAKVPDFSDLSFTINDSQFMIGDFLNAIISFLLVAAAIFFFVVKPVNMLMARARRSAPQTPITKKCSECLGEIPIEAKRCMYCTQLQQ